MLEQVKTLLRERELTEAVIVDDAYDAQPRVEDVSTDRWSRFFDDLRDDDEELLRQIYPQYADKEPSDLQRDPMFLSALWNLKEKIRTDLFDSLFGDFESEQADKRSDLEPLERILREDLEINCMTVGRGYNTEESKGDIFFVDLFLGHVDDDESIDRAIQKIREITSKCDQPPIVILMSANPRLEQSGPRFRDDAKLLGCLFRVMKKSDLVNADKLLESLYDLAIGYADGLKLANFIQVWSDSLDNARQNFMKQIRRLDLSDYANVHELVLAAEGEPVGDYMIELYDTYLHHIIEGDTNLIQAAQDLNTIEWDEDHPSHFIPSDDAVGILDGVMFQNRTRLEAQEDPSKDPKNTLHLGDVLFTDSQKSEQEALLVLSQACDLQHGNTDRLLFIRGKTQPYKWQTHEKHDAKRTPILKYDQEEFVIDWDTKSPETWTFDEARKNLSQGGKFKKVRRFRLLYALQLQQRFITDLGRVGTPTPLPARYPVGVRIYLKDNDGYPMKLCEALPDDEKAIVVVGRDAKGNSMEKLSFDPQFVDTFREAILAVEEAKLFRHARTQIVAVRNNPNFYRKLKAKLTISQDQDKKPFQTAAKIATEAAKEAEKGAKAAEEAGSQAESQALRKKAETARQAAEQANELDVVHVLCKTKLVLDQKMSDKLAGVTIEIISTDDDDDAEG